MERRGPRVGEEESPRELHGMSFDEPFRWGGVGVGDSFAVENDLESKALSTLPPTRSATTLAAMKRATPAGVRGVSARATGKSGPARSPKVRVAVVTTLGVCRSTLTTWPEQDRLCHTLSPPFTATHKGVLLTYHRGTDFGGVAALFPQEDQQILERGDGRRMVPYFGFLQTLYDVHHSHRGATCALGRERALDRDLLRKKSTGRLLLRMVNTRARSATRSEGGSRQPECL